MLLRMFYDDALAQASWMVGCQATGEALVVDPNRDVETYLEAAEREGLRITHVTETHIHADYVSGARELAHRSGARLYLSDEGGPDWRYGYAAEERAVLLKDGDTFTVGNVRIQALHTPGHTPEHLSFLVTDGAAADEPMGILTGDFVFVGDVGRPDLLERAAGVSGTMEAGARQLFRSIRRFLTLPDYVQVWPGHGAGSACGKALGAVPQTTVGYERRFSWALRIQDEDAFVEAVLAGQPEPPRYFAEMKRINRDGPRVLGEYRRPPELDARELDRVLASGGVVVDTRSAAAHARGHVPGTLGIPLNRAFATWAGWLLPYDAPIHLIVERDGGAGVDAAVRDLARIGLDRVAGFFAAAAVDAWAAAGRPLQRIEAMDNDALERAVTAGRVFAIDVRGAVEWEAGHVPGLINIPLGHLPDRLAELPDDRPIVVSCQSGGRSAIAASVLQRLGRTEVVNHVAGFAGWRASGREVEVGQPTPV